MDLSIMLTDAIPINHNHNKDNNKTPKNDARKFEKQSQEIFTICNNIENLAKAILYDPEGQILTNDEQMRLLEFGTSEFARLRLLNRRFHDEQLVLKGEANGKKERMDNLSLELENIKKEQIYVQKEITSTEHQETIYQKIPLIPEEEFRSSAPKEFLLDIDTPHKLMLNRLRFEIKQREMLKTEKEKLDRLCTELRNNKRKRAERLEKIDSHIRTYAKSLAVLGKSLGAEKSVESKSLKDSDVNDLTEYNDETPKVKRTRKVQEMRVSSRLGTPKTLS